jgi:hypothetical protein
MQISAGRKAERQEEPWPVAIERSLRDASDVLLPVLIWRNPCSDQVLNHIVEVQIVVRDEKW